MNGTYEHIVLGAGGRVLALAQCRLGHGYRVLVPPGQEVTGRGYYRRYRESMKPGEVP